jgi:predicted ribosome quality control (RQC) complex YloA/Tae2 family protein
VRVIGYGTDHETLLDIQLEPALDGMENARRLYRRARKLDRGRPGVEKRLADIRSEVARLREAIGAASRGEDALAGVGDLLPPSRRPKGAGKRRESEPLRMGGYAVFVGRSAMENDALLRRAAPDDIWLHARGAAGAHVIVRRGAGGEIPREVLEEAARLAARRSRSDVRGKVEVTFAPAKHVRKPKGAPPGLVIVSHGSTLTVEL